MTDGRQSCRRYPVARLTLFPDPLHRAVGKRVFCVCVAVTYSVQTRTDKIFSVTDRFYK